MAGLLLLGVAVGLRYLTNSDSETAKSATTPPPAPTEPGPAFTSPLRLVYSQFGLSEDTIQVVNLTAIDQPQALAQIPHARGWGIAASLSPDGQHLAYTVLAAGARNPSTQAELWLLDVASGEGRLLAQGLDLLPAPLWSPDGSSLLARRHYQGEEGRQGVELLAVATATGEATSLLKVEDILDLFPIAFSPDGASLYYAQIGSAGTHFGRLSLADGSAALFLQASPSLARDWRLSPDGSRIVFLAPTKAGDKVYMHPYVVDLTEAEPQARPLAAFAGQDHFSPIWNPDSRTITLGTSATAITVGAVAMVPSAGGHPQVGPVPSEGFDVPIAWSPDGRFLVVRSFQGPTPHNAGRSRMVVIAPDGSRWPLGQGQDVKFIGWLNPKAQ